jgi:cobalt/nickel transport system ATP-binding protein
MPEPIFNLTDIHYMYLSRFPALCGINLEIQKGKKYVFAGANGSGKSTLLNLLDGLIFPDKGRLEAFGEECSAARFENNGYARSFRRKVGFVFQNSDAQLFCPTVREEIMFGPLQLEIPESESLKRIDFFVEHMGIGPLMDRSPHQLSAGEKRKVALVSVLAIGPEVLLLDEPTAGLDPLTTRAIVDIILSYSKEGKTVITATHDLHIIEEIADCVHVLTRDRSLTRALPPQEFLSDTGLLAENNLLHLHRHAHEDKEHLHPHQHLHHY